MDDDLALVPGESAEGDPDIIFDDGSEEAHEDFPEKSEEEAEPEKSDKKKKTKKGKGKIKPETMKLIGIIVCIVAMIGVCGAVGVTLIRRGLILGIIVIAAGFCGAIFVLMVNINRLKMYEKMTEMTKKSYIKESERLDQDMEKCQGRIAALDARAEERGKDAPPPSE